MVRSDTESSDLKGALAALEDVLRARAPAIAQALRPGIDVGSLTAISSRLAFELPSAVQELFMWHDGTDVVDASNRAELFPGGQMLPLENAVTALNEALIGDRESETYRWNSSWLPIFTDNMGSWHAVACTQSAHPVVNIYFIDLPDTHLGYSNLHEMVQSLVNRWRARAYWQTERGVVEEDPRAVAALRRSSDKEAPNFTRLVSDLNGESLERHLAALEIMRTRLYPEAVNILIRLLQTGSPRGRKAAAELLGSIGDPAARSVLQTASQSDPDDIIRMYAAEALGQLKRSN